LAAHIYTRINSLQLTTVANSIFLESTHPIFGWILSVIFLKEKGTRLIAAGMISGLIGMYLIISGDISQSPGAILGDLLAVLSAFCLAAYLLIARMMTSKTALIPYLLWVYGTAAIFLLLTGIITDLDFTGLGQESWLFLILLALGPNLIGHSLLNWASRKIEVFKINIALLAEPVLATIYAVFFFDEYPGLTFFVGALFILSSILTIFSYERKTL
ncbi:MAG: DMT family transporter, partial [Calditrichaceae bacterium]